MHQLPTQVYKPENFAAEVNKIGSISTVRYNYLYDRYERRDSAGNVYEIDWNNGTITVN